jgi:DNA-binding transcriptional regulator YiaG
MYHYTESGLDNVWLVNGYTVRKTAYGKAVAVIGADSLHAFLVNRLLKKAGRLTGKEVRFLRSFLGFSQANLGTALGVTDQAVSLWERTGRVPKSGDALLRVIVAAKLDKATPVGDLVERINELDRKINQRIVVREAPNKSGGWVVDAPDEASEAVAA